MLFTYCQNQYKIMFLPVLYNLEMNYSYWLPKIFTRHSLQKTNFFNNLIYSKRHDHLKSAEKKIENLTTVY